MSELVQRLFLAAHDEWDISKESRELARDALAEIERLRELVNRLRRTIDVGDLSGLARREGA